MHFLLFSQGLNGLFPARVEKLRGAQIEADIECDTFFPEMSLDKWRLWSESAPRRDGDMRYSFQCYVPASASSSSSPPALPPAVAAQHEELQARQPLSFC